MVSSILRKGNKKSTPSATSQPYLVKRILASLSYKHSYSVSTCTYPLCYALASIPYARSHHFLFATTQLDKILTKLIICAPKLYQYTIAKCINSSTQRRIET